MRVLVTGGAGYIGSHTVAVLKRSGAEVLVIDNLSTGTMAAVAADTQFLKVELRSIDETIKAFERFKPDVVLHFAASLIVSESVEKPLSYYDNNLNSLMNVLRAMKATNCSKIVFSSTAAVYGIAHSTQVTEGEITLPINPYGRSKLFCEGIVRDFTLEYPDFRAVFLRYFNVAGASLEGNNGQRSPNATHLIKLACETAVGARDHLKIFGTDYGTADGTCVRDYIHVEDLARAHTSSIGYLSAGGDTDVFNCGYGVGHSVYEVVETIQQLAGRQLPIQLVARREGDPPSLVANVDKILRTLDWRPQLNSLKTICESALEWERKLRSR